MDMDNLEVYLSEDRLNCKVYIVDLSVGMLRSTIEELSLDSSPYTEHVGYNT